ncbi:LysR family transcriptional regulator [Allohahella marinimesophila]|uniref:LysR family transcriptional regulator n=1 Tax=Allohahella marinimesophila TaxID=1054972 RepID=A0ABP7NK94_9GAMM
MERLSRVEFFLEIVRHKSFTGAANALGTSGSALSKQMQNLEAQLGVKLLNRTTRHVSLTEAGAIYYERARQALEDLAEAERQIQDLGAAPQGSLKISAPMSFGRRHLVKPFAAFAARYPEVHLQIDFDDRHVDLVSEGYDVAIRIASLADSTLVARRLADCPIMLCASPSYLQQHGRPETPEDLAGHRHIIYSRHGLQSDWLFEHKDGRQGSVYRHAHMLANSAEMMSTAVAEGIGIGLLPIFAAAQQLKAGTMEQILADYKTIPDRGIYAMYPQNRYLSAKVRLLIDELLTVGQTLPW